MLNKVKSRFSGKYVTLLFITLLVFTKSFTAEYIVPKKPASVDVSDIDLDGDLDIVLGHDCHQGDYWGMITILKNNSDGVFTLVDTFPTFAYETSLQVNKVNVNDYPDIIANDYNENVPSPVFTVINDYELYCWNYITQFCYEFITVMKYKIYHSAINDLVDLVFISNLDFLWAVMYNDGSGQFSLPQYYYLDYPPTDLAIGDLNGDDRADILIVGGQRLDAWLNYETGLEYTNIIDSTYAIRGVITDIDNDGDNDIITIVAIFPGAPAQLAIYSNNNGSFTLSYNKWIDEAMGYIFISDLNNDNFPDVIYNCSLYYPNSNYEIFHTYILFNNQDGTFQDPVNYYTGICSHKSYSADLDGNGWNDIITLNYDFYNPPPDTCRIHILFNDGTGSFVEEPQVGIYEDCITYNEQCKLSNYPNPFKPSGVGRSLGTTINYDLPVNIANPVIEIFNIKGEKIKTFNCQNQMPIIWDGADQYHKSVSSGVYLYRLKTDEGVLTSKKMLLLK